MVRGWGLFHWHEIVKLMGVSRQSGGTGLPLSPKHTWHMALFHWVVQGKTLSWLISSRLHQAQTKSSFYMDFLAHSGDMPASQVAICPMSCFPAGNALWQSQCHCNQGDPKEVSVNTGSSHWSRSAAEHSCFSQSI